MDLRFDGDLSLWQGLLLGALLTALVWWVYRREVRERKSSLALLLPSLRALTVLLIVLMLTGPVLSGRVRIGDLSRVLVVVDESKSMGLTDTAMQPGRKLLNAFSSGLLPEDAVPGKPLHDAANLLHDAIGRMSQNQKDDDNAASAEPAKVAPASPDTPEDAIQAARRRLDAADDQSLERLATSMELPLGGSESEGDRGDQDTSTRSLVIARFTRELLEPLTESSEDADSSDAVERVVTAARTWRQHLDTAFATGIDDAIQGNDPRVDGAIKRFDSTSRWDRISRLLLNADTGLLGRISDEHVVELHAVSGSESKIDETQSLWRNQDAAELPTSLGAESPAGAATNIADGIRSIVGRQQDAPKTAVVLLTDGQHNDTRSDAGSPLHLARVLERQGIPVFPVGIGAVTPPADLAVLSVSSPQSVFRDDRVAGEIVISDHMPAGQPANLTIELDGETIWTEAIESNGGGIRSVDFEFEVKPLIDRQLTAAGDDVGRSLALPLTARIDAVDDDAEASNNTHEFRVRAMTQSRRALLIDGRPRWEFRYLRNLFERDHRWEVNHVLVEVDAAGRPRMQRGTAQGQFPRDRDELFAYDLIVFGDVPVGTLTLQEQELLKDFVASRGGGLFLIDGRRGHLPRYVDGPMRPLIPVDWTSRVGAVPASLRLTDTGRTLAELAFDADDDRSARVWSRLPAPRWVASVKALPGTEILAETTAGKQTIPAFVRRRFGAGTVVYSAVEESWRWRYKVGDHYHQRFWNQLADATMEPPYAVRTDFVSIDPGSASYERDSTANLRISLRDKAGRPIEQPEAEALIYRNDEIVATLPLVADPNSGGTLRATTETLPSGQYQVGVRATGIDDDRLSARAEFVVLGEPTGELNALHCDEDLLRRMASQSGGQYLREEDIGELALLLEPFSETRIEDREIVLWRSWWWFLPIVGLFTTEWLVRKRTGLM